jgi:hypothetical protein
MTPVHGRPDGGPTNLDWKNIMSAWSGYIWCAGAALCSALATLLMKLSSGPAAA